ncbi:MAG: hypothetical protein ACLGJC_25310 [Alphaproteobacteria bacterium]
MTDVGSTSPINRLVRRLLPGRPSSAQASRDTVWSLQERVQAAKRAQGSTVYYTPAMIVARAVPCPRPADAGETAYYDALRLLQAEEIWLVQRWHEGRVSYIATPSTRFNPDGDNACTPLAQALPGHPLHRGDGAYLASLDDGNHAVILVRAGTLQVSLGTEREVLAFASDRGAEAITVDLNAAEDWVPWQLAVLRYRRRIGLMIGGAGGLSALTAAVAVIGATMWQSSLLEERALIESQSADYTRALEMQLAEAVKQPLLSHVARIQRLRDLKAVLGDTAYLVRYEVKDGKWSWTAQVPEWANDRTLRPFGGGIHLSASPAHNGALLATLQGDG